MHNVDYMLWQDVCLSVRLSHAGILLKRLNVSSNFFHHRVATPFWFYHTKRYGNRDLPNGGNDRRLYETDRNFRPVSRFIEEMIRATAIVTMEHQ